MEHIKKGIKVGDTTIFDLESMFLRLLTIGQQRQVELGPIFQYELCPGPPSLIDEYGSLRRGSKAPLVHNLCVTTKPTLLPDVTIVDVSQLLYHIAWPDRGDASVIVASINKRLSTLAGDRVLVFAKYYDVYIMRQANLEELDIGVKMGGRKINNLRYADDTTLLAESKEELLQLVTNVKEKSAQAGLYLNLKKTKVMSTEEIEEFELDGENIEIVRDFVFLGAKIEDSGSCKGEILRRLALGRAAMTGLNKIWKDKDITITTKCRIVNALVFPVVLYGCESWTIRKAERRRIDSFELWCWRRLLRIPWTARRTNQSVIEEIKPTNPLEALIKKQQLSYFGHIMRSENSLEKSMMLGMGGGARKRGRPRA